jgi:hypothetical protein
MCNLMYKCMCCSLRFITFNWYCSVINCMATGSSLNWWYLFIEEMHITEKIWRFVTASTTTEAVDLSKLIWLKVCGSFCVVCTWLCCAYFFFMWMYAMVKEWYCKFSPTLLSSSKSGLVVHGKVFIFYIGWSLLVCGLLSNVSRLFLKYSVTEPSLYRDADKSLARPGRKQATVTEDFDFHISHL